MTEATFVERFGAFAATAFDHGVPEEVADSVRQRVLDILGIAIAATELDTSRAVIEHVAEQGGVEQAHAIGLPGLVPANQAALVNGTLSHSLDYDDTHLPSVLHPSAPVVPAALAAAERDEASGRDLIAAIAVGLEICVRLGMAGYDRDAGNSLFFERGQHATSICGAIGGAASAALLLGGGTEAVANAMGLAVSMASGLLEANRAGGTVKRIHCGWAAHAAVTAAELVARGFTGPPTVLEGRFGFFEGFLDGEYHPDELTDGLGERWSVPDIHFKPYPANHFTHTAIDAVIRMREQGLTPEQLGSVHLGVAAPTVRTIGEPIEGKRSPETGYQAQFSGPYVVAAAMLGGSGLGLGLDDFTDDLARDPERREIMAKVTVEADDRCTEIYPNEFPAVVRVRTTDGGERVEEVLANRGGPQRPLSEEELVTKFRDNAARVVAEDRIRALEEAVLGLDAADEVSALFDGTGELW